jgi:DNA-binding CsgD family transcriptional regulator
MGAAAGSIMLISDLQRKYSIPFLQSFLYYEVLIVIFGFYSLFGLKALDIITRTTEIPVSIKQIIRLVIIYIGVPFYITGWFMFIKQGMEFRGNNISQKQTFIFFLTFLILFLTYGIIYTYKYRAHPELSLFPNTVQNLIFIVVELIIPIMVLLINWRQRRYPRILKIMSADQKNYFFLIVLFHIFSIIFFSLIKIHAIFYALFLLLFFIRDLPAVFYLRSKLMIYQPLFDENTNSNSGYDLFYESFSISKREKEIINLVIIGKTNKEISAVLFITLQTVKDHISRIFQKTGVRNRVELINLIGSYNSGRLNL